MENVKVLGPSAADFLTELFGHQPIHLTAIIPDGAARAQSFDEPLDVQNWVNYQNQTSNIYFSVNSVPAELNKKAKKTDLQFLRALHIDLDPDKTADKDTERARLAVVIEGMSPKPTAVVDSGNGYACYWVFKQPVPATDESIEWLEGMNRALAIEYGGDMGTWNADRIMRLPGTINYPNAKKKQYGYGKTASQVVSIRPDYKYDWEQLIERWEPVGRAATEVGQYDREVGELSPEFEALLATDINIATTWEGAPTENQQDMSRSGYDMVLLSQLKARGFTKEETFAILMLFPYGKLADSDNKYFERMWDNSQAQPPAVPKRLAGEELMQRYCFVSAQARWWDALGCELLTKQAVDVEWAHIHPGTNKMPRATTLWERSPEKLIVDNVTWDPRESDLFTREGKRYLNMWKAPVMQPNGKAADKWLEHVRFLFPVKEDREHLLNWLGYLVQVPGGKANHQIVVGGIPGIGKDLLFQPLAEYYRDSFKEIGAELLHQPFNEYLLHTKLIFVEEIMDYSKGEIENKLKPFCASPPNELDVNVKGLRSIKVPNLLALVFFTNHRNAMQISDKGERRYFCLWSEAQPADRAYYQSLAEWYEAGGYEAVIGHLLKRDLREFFPKAPAPKTAFREELYEASKSEMELALEEYLGELPDVITHDVLRKHEVLGRHNMRAVGTILRKMGCERRMIRSRVEGRVKTKRIWIIRDHDRYAAMGDKDLWEDQW